MILGVWKMKRKTLSLRIDVDVIEFIDTLVKLGFYTDRDKALREMIKLGKERLYGEVMLKISNIVDKIIKFEEKAGEQAINASGLRKLIISERDQQ